jgi:hypothetical protein
VYGRINRPDTRKHLDYARTPPQILLASLGASTHRSWRAAEKPTFRSAPIYVIQGGESRSRKRSFVQLIGLPHGDH